MKLTKLTPEQEAALVPYADEWIARSLDCTPADRGAVEDGMRRCYEYAGIPWHGNVVWVDSPVVAMLAGSIAASILDVHGAVHEAVHGAVGVAVHGAVDGAVDVAVAGAVRGAVHEAVHGAVGGAVHGAVHGAVDVAVHEAVHEAVHGAVAGAVRGAVAGAVRGAVAGAVDVAVDRAVAGAVAGAVRDWYRYIGGHSWTGWIAWRSYFRDICHLDLPGDTWDRHAAYEAANQASAWWPHRQFVIVSDRPTEIHLEQVGPRGWGSHQLHQADGPALAYRDGWMLHYWHGVSVPAWVCGADGGPTLERINGEANTEVRRCAIEAYGWDRYLADLGVSPVDVADDPGNPGHVLRLFDLPTQLYPEPVRLLVMQNASLDRDGSRRTFAETVPASCRTAIDAAAWQFDLDPDLYRSLLRAS